MTVLLDYPLSDEWRGVRMYMIRHRLPQLWHDHIFNKKFSRRQE